MRNTLLLLAVLVLLVSAVLIGRPIIERTYGIDNMTDMDIVRFNRTDIVERHCGPGLGEKAPAAVLEAVSKSIPTPESLQVVWYDAIYMRGFDEMTYMMAIRYRGDDGIVVQKTGSGAIRMRGCQNVYWYAQ